MLVRDFDYELPVERIAQRPRPRGESRLLLLDAADEARHRSIRDLPALLRTGDLLVVNDTRVLRARLFARRLSGGARVELLLAERLDAADLGLPRPARPQGPPRRPSRARRRARAGARGGGGRHRTGGAPPARASPSRSSRTSSGSDTSRCRPTSTGPTTPRTRERYQTVWAREPGAIAAPTAGLHFDAALLAGARRARRRTRRASLSTSGSARSSRSPPSWCTSTAWTPSASRCRRRPRRRSRARAASAAASSRSAPRWCGRSRARRARTVRCRRRGDERPVRHPRLSVPRRGRAAHQLPPAALDAAHAGLGVRRPRARARRLSRGDRRRLPLSTPTATRCSPSAEASLRRCGR